ncbi:MAG: diaminopropionate ammonia-lyase [Rhodospirillaceae bacterium]|nr:diaminopropionate ammonia-lyase [Rhodospirillaceae bacterium]MBT5048245.1 diaminopropionate ammonia-lyase [Rhodospirillaceae bacterium]MBT5895182.1 diaminopropionate ammonia-lyase [Rhodospirillaceae bacterium]MBT6429409.1 diaminopropionate ammonia-lyase [Rhodospirillaceae bacterium]MBT7757816.1 diaminopropionate ammonia-lyase [Rhodospirillaceae bacterium]
MPALTDHVARAVVAEPYPAEVAEVFSTALFEAAESEIPQWPGYAPTPLRDLDRLAGELNIGAALYKDESGRFGLGSFKALGGAYAVMRLLAEQCGGVSLSSIRAGDHGAAVEEITVTAATDGNHGRSVAWGAQQAGCKCRIYIHRDVSEGRQRAMEALGAEVVRTAGDYDDSVRICAREAAANGWHVVSDTSYPGYDRIPRDVMAGYGVLTAEILAAPGPRPSHIILQAGVGGMAAAICARMWLELGAACPRVIIVEADRAPSLLASARAGDMRTVEIREETIMAGLSCGEVSPLAWNVLHRCTDHFVTVSDDLVAPAMRCLASGDLGGGAIEGGECSTPGLLTLIAAATDAGLRREFELDQNSRVLLIGSEGATDPEIYQAIMAAG